MPNGNGNGQSKISQSGWVSVGLLVVLVCGAVSVATSAGIGWAKLSHVEGENQRLERMLHRLQENIPPPWFEQMVRENQSDIRKLRAEVESLRKP